MSELVAYASRTGTRRNLAALRDAGWRLLVSARGVHRTEGFPYALDNGAWSAYQKGEAFDVAAFVLAYERLGAGADWVVAPDQVAAGLASLELTLEWLPQLRDARMVLIAVQDGIEATDVRPYLGARVGLFLGGSTEWKLRTARAWGALAREVGCYYHFARVNSAKRIRLAQDVGAHSFDGTAATRFAVNVPRLTNATRQGYLFK